MDVQDVICVGGMIMNNKQKELKQKFDAQTNYCKCGFPIPPSNIIIKEGFFTISRFYKEYEYTCRKCKITQVRIQ